VLATIEPISMLHSHKSFFIQFSLLDYTLVLVLYFFLLHETILSLNVKNLIHFCKKNKNCYAFYSIKEKYIGKCNKNKLNNLKFLEEIQVEEGNIVKLPQVFSLHPH